MKKKEEVMVVVPEIGEDLIMEILLRLQPVSVLKFKCVSKSWYALITHSSFLPNHARQFHLSQLLHQPPLMEPPGLLLSPTTDFLENPKHSVYFLPQDQDQKPDTPNMLKVFLDHSLPEFQENFPDCYLIDSCNGLLLYRTESGTPNQYTVFNPITNQYKQVPLMNLLETFIKPNEELAETTTVFNHPRIVYDPSISLSYKVLAVLRGPPYKLSELYVYSSDTGSWKGLVTFANRYITSTTTFMFNGVFYWLCHRDSICFDFVKETVWIFSLPPVPVKCPYCAVLYFGEFDGRIRLIQEYRDGNYDPTFACSFDIMEMEQGSRNLTTITRVNLGAYLETSDPFSRVVVQIMHHYKTDKGEEVVLLKVDYKTVIFYNITTETLGKKLTMPYSEHLACLNAFPFRPTLYPLL